MPGSGEPPALSHRGLAVVGVRLLAVYLLVEVVEVLALSILPVGSGPVPAGTVALSAAVIAAAALILWVGTGPLATAMLPARRALSREHGDAVTHRGIACLAFGIFGLYLVVDALPRLLASAWLYRDSSEVWQLIAEPGLRLMLGVVVLFGADGLARFVVWLRHAGRW